MFSGMKKYFVWALSAAILFSAVSCGKEDDGIEPPYLLVRELTVPSTAYEQFISVTTDGEWTLNVGYSGSQSGWVTFSQDKGVGTITNLHLICAENTGDNPRTCQITLSSRGLSSSVSITQDGKSSGGGGTTPENTFNGVPSTSIGWLELPATNASDGKDFFTIPMTFGGKKTRNYSFYWDYSNFNASWVAYAHIKDYHKNNTGARQDDYKTFPGLSLAQQPVAINGFKDGNNGWYARGHQLPQADRRYDRSMNSDANYVINLTPQIQEGFNDGIWATLEAKVRNWAQSSDTVYVVTGCVTKGSTYYVLDNLGKHIPVPTAYYKAVLRYKSDATIGFNGYIAMGYYLEHKAYSSGSVTKEHAMSIDDLETKLGFDLFPNLVKVIGEPAAANVEKQDPTTVTWWWL